MINETPSDPNQESTLKHDYLKTTPEDYPQFLNRELAQSPEIKAALEDMENKQIKAGEGEVILDVEGQPITYDGGPDIPEKIYEVVATTHGIRFGELKMMYKPKDKRKNLSHDTKEFTHDELAAAYRAMETHERNSDSQ